MISIIFAAIFALLAYFIFVNRARACVIQTVPGVYPIFGSLFTLSKVTDNLARWAYDQCIKFNFAPFEVTAFSNLHFIVLQDSKQVEHMLRNNWTNYLNNTSTKGFLEIGKEFWGRGIFMVDGQEWQTHRKAASHLFSLNALRTKMYHVFFEHTHKLVEILNSRVGKEIDIQELFQSFAFDCMCEIAFGITPGAMHQEKRPQFLIDFDAAQVYISHRMKQPLALVRFRRWLRMGTEKEYQLTCDRLTAYCHEIIQQRKKAGDLEDRGDLLSMYISFGRKSNQPHMLTDAYLKDVILNFMVAGRDTTASTLTHMFRALAENPSVHDKLREDLDSMPLTGNVQMDVETLMNQDPLRNVMYETLRLYPAVPMMSRFAIKDDTMPGNLPIRSGALCMINILAMNRNPSVWPEPLAFAPSRWEGKELPSEFDFPTFWAGPRVCLGRVMAQTEIMVAAGMIARTFKFTVAGKNAFTMEGGPVWFYREGLKMFVDRASA